MRSGWYQAELLLAREPVSELRDNGTLTEHDLAQLDLIADTKRWGGEIGLAATENYETLAVDWKRTIWNLTACDPVSFTPTTWWFPIVGRVPYLGFFVEEDARKRAQKLQKSGQDVYLRTAGAYSTLGYFRDPILPGMLEWSEANLVDTVLHEMTHATLWVAGSVDFNESLASFVGETAALRYLVERYGAHSEPVLQELQAREDWAAWRSLQRALLGKLEALYANPTLNDDEKLQGKQRIFEQFPEDVVVAGFHQPQRYIDAARNGVWNNARLMQFQTYNEQPQLFQNILDMESGDLVRFLDRVNEITDSADDPFAAMAAFVQDSGTL
ncbi:MAG: aminopeptidase [Myxococcota bacterium]|nr:aminopeptidase [Myxococcota bacterium]